jgi:hypothetical protein
MYVASCRSIALRAARPGNFLPSSDRLASNPTMDDDTTRLILLRKVGGVPPMPLYYSLSSLLGSSRDFPD